MTLTKPHWPDGLTIRSVRVEDAEAICTMATLPGFRAGTLRPPFPRVADTRKWLESQDDRSVNIVAELDGRLVGNAGFDRYTGRRDHAATLGIGIHDDFTGRGIGRVLMQELIEAADQWIGLHRLELTVFTENARAIALYRSLGFVEEGRLRDYALTAGRYVDALAMARLRPR
jgi:putative acetyltransferase